MNLFQEIFYLIKKVHNLCFIPDISRASSTQKQSRSIIAGVKVGETHDVIKVR